MLKWLKNILRSDSTPSASKQSAVDDTQLPQWKPEIVVHPQYWIESNYSQIEKLSPFLRSMVERALREKYFVDIAVEVTIDSIKLLHDTLAAQLNAMVSREDGVWTVAVKNNLVTVGVRVFEDDRWVNAMKSWTVAQEIIKHNGLQLHAVEEDWDRVKLTGNIKIPTSKLTFSMDSILLWNVLHRNKPRIILWEKKLWIPNNT